MTAAPATRKPSLFVTRTRRGFRSGSFTYASWKSVDRNFVTEVTSLLAGAGASPWSTRVSRRPEGQSRVEGAVTPPECPPWSWNAASPVSGSRMR